MSRELRSTARVLSYTNLPLAILGLVLSLPLLDTTLVDRLSPAISAPLGAEGNKQAEAGGSQERTACRFFLLLGCAGVTMGNTRFPEPNIGALRLREIARGTSVFSRAGLDAPT